MSVSTMHRSRTTRGGEISRLFWGWSHDNARMEMMDLSGYIDSLREGYERAVEDYGQQYPALARGYGTGLECARCGGGTAETTIVAVVVLAGAVPGIIATGMTAAAVTMAGTAFTTGITTATVTVAW